MTEKTLPVKPRARDLGIPFSGKPGKYNAITDVAGVEVGHSTIIEGENVRTGVTAVWTRGFNNFEPVFGGWFSLNGNGEMTGTAWIEESGFVEGPILLTNTHSVGIVRDSYIRWALDKISNQRANPQNPKPENFFLLPVVAETSDAYLNDMNGFHVREKHVVEALENACGGAVREGNVGSGTGMICYQFKAGIGTASRVIDEPIRGTVGVLVQANCGKRSLLTVAGVPVGLEIPEEYSEEEKNTDDAGSIIILVATDLPILPHQAKRLARRASMGLARTGATAANGSGDLFLAFSTAEVKRKDQSEIFQVEMLHNNLMSYLFEAVVEATEEAIINSLVAAETMVGKNRKTVPSIPLDKLVSALKKYNRRQQPG